LGAPASPVDQMTRYKAWNVLIVTVAIATVTIKTRFHNAVARHLSTGETVRECSLARGWFFC